MRFSFIILFAVSIISFSSCTKAELPQCLEELLTLIDLTCADSKIDAYKFQGKTVYVLDFQPSTCFFDGQSEVVDEDCNSLGFLGGLIGNTTINDEEFSEAKFLDQVWP